MIKSIPPKINITKKKKEKKKKKGKARLLEMRI